MISKLVPIATMIEWLRRWNRNNGRVGAVVGYAYLGIWVVFFALIVASFLRII